MKLFDDPLHDEFASWPLGLLQADGGAIGEITYLAGQLADADDKAFVSGWLAAAQRHVEVADEVAKKGRRAEARGHYLRAASFYEVGIHVLYGAPPSAELIDAFGWLTRAFDRAVQLDNPPGEPLSIPFDGHQMPGYFLRADGVTETDVRPLVILTNGYDATMADMYLAMAVDIKRHGYHCLIFDGPGQGAMLVDQGVPLIAEWERVISAVVDLAVARSDVDTSRIALQGWSLGGFLAARAASGEHRLAACVLDPPNWSLMDGMPQLAQHLGVSAEAAAELPSLSDPDQATMMTAIDAVPGLRWKVVQRGFWVNGVPDLRGYMASLATFTLDGRGDAIACPTLATAPEGDMLAARAGDFLKRLSCPTTLLTFTNEEGAGDHCELANRWLANARILDWLDDTFAAVG